MTGITERKSEHLRIVAEESVQFPRGMSGFDAIRFEHCAMPGLRLQDIDLSSHFLGFSLDAPLLISSMTGGPAESARINRNLAEAASAAGIAMAVGSQRASLVEGNTGGLDRDLRRYAGKAPLFANMGAGQLIEPKCVETMRRAVNAIAADALIIHLNPLQECLQSRGDTDWLLVSSKLEKLISLIEVPVIVKEVGFGISGGLAMRLRDMGVSAIDAAGAGGTNWALVESRLHKGTQLEAVGQAFGDWGIPTAEAVIRIKQACPLMPLIASGGVRHGVDVARAIRIGADLVGQAAGLLESARHSTEAVLKTLEATIHQLRIVCFCTNSKSLDALRQAPLLLHDTATVIALAEIETRLWNK